MKTRAPAWLPRVNVFATFLFVLAVATVTLPARSSPVVVVEEICVLMADAGLGDPIDDGDATEDVLTRLFPDAAGPATNETTIGRTGTFSAENASFKPVPPNTQPELYVVDGGRLGTLSLTTAQFSPKPNAVGSGSGASGTVTFNNIDGLAFDRDGTLYASHRKSGADVLLKINPSTGARVPNAFGSGVDYVVIDPVDNLTNIDDLAIDPADGTLYGLANEDNRDDRLVRINKANGDTTDVGPAGTDAQDLEGLGFRPNGSLLGTVGKDGLGESLWTINKATGAASNRRGLDNAQDYEAVACTEKTTITEPERFHPSCRASALRVTGRSILSFLGTIEPFVANDADDPCTAEETGLIPNLDLGVVSARVLRAATTLDGSGTVAASEASVVEVRVTAGTLVLGATLLSSRADVTCSNQAQLLSGSSTVLGVTVGATQITVPPGHLDVPIPGLGTLHLNEQIVEPIAEPNAIGQRLTQRALWLDTILLEVVIAESQVDCVREL